MITFLDKVYARNGEVGSKWRRFRWCDSHRLQVDPSVRTWHESGYWPHRLLSKWVCIKFQRLIHWNIDSDNSGTDQPGCSIEKRSIGCNHRRAIELFIESINTKCNFTAFACDSWTRFSTEKKCSSCGKNKGLCARMGYYAVDWKKFKSNTKSKKFYLNTNSDVPFCGNNLNSGWRFYLRTLSDRRKSARRKSVRRNWFNYFTRNSRN